jgi:hypothetical protein
MNIAAGASALAASRYGTEASVAILKQAMDTAADSTAALVETMVTPAPLPPAGGVGTRIDIKL